MNKNIVVTMLVASSLLASCGNGSNGTNTDRTGTAPDTVSVSAQINELDSTETVTQITDEPTVSNSEQSVTITHQEDFTETSQQTTPAQPIQDSIEEELIPIPTSPLCVSHFNGYEYCVDRATRYFSASNSIDGVWWGFELPGENSTNSIVDIIAIENQLALIADKMPSTEAAEYIPENTRYELSLFSLEGSFIDTRLLLQIPETLDFVSICSENSLDECTPSLATHKLTRNEFWQYQHELALVDTVSNKAINVDNYELLITELSYFWDSEHFGYLGDVLKPFYASLGDQMVDTQMTLDNIPDGWLDTYANSVDSSSYELKLCPDGGSIAKFNSNPSVTLFQQCKHLDWLVNGQRSAMAAHRTSDLHYTDFTLTRNEEITSLTGGYSNTGGGLYGSSGKKTKLFIKQTENRRTEMRFHSSSNSWGAAFNDDFYDGASVILDDGRTGQYRDRGDGYHRSSVGYSLIDSAFANTKIQVSANRNRANDGTSITLSDGNYLREPQEVLIIFNHPNGEIRQWRQYYAGPLPNHFTSGKATFNAEDGSQLEVLPISSRQSPLAIVNVYDGETETPMFTTYMDFRI